MIPGSGVESRQGMSRRAESVSSTGFVFPNGMNHHTADRVTSTGRTSMSVRVEVFADNHLTGERKRATSGYLTMVALDAAGKPTPVPRLIVETKEERAEYEAAAQVREAAI